MNPAAQSSTACVPKRRRLVSAGTIQPRRPQREVQGGIAGLAQLEERRPRNAEAACSSHAAGTTINVQRPLLSTGCARLVHRPYRARAAHIGLGPPLARPAQIGPDHSQADMGGPGIQRSVAGRAHAPAIGVLLPDGAERASPAARFGAACIDPDPLIVGRPITALCRLARPDADECLNPWRCGCLR
jgi:hypothetical protein